MLADAAREVRDRLADLKLESFVKTTGGKGLHVVVPLKPAADWDAVKDFAHALANAMAADAPDRFVSVMTKARRTERIFIDYLRNGRGATAVAAYSTRAREGAPVATPLTWEELRSDVRGARFNLKNMMRRMKRLGADPWEGFFGVKQRLPALKRKRSTRRA
jgi:bifunctional non-homologous end joining protein LigD